MVKSILITAILILIPVSAYAQATGNPAQEPLTPFHLVSAATTNATSVKASAAKLCGWYISNSNVAARKVVFHNTAGTPTAGAGVYFTTTIPAGSAANVFSDRCITFPTGIAITTVTGLADTDATAVAANDLVINLFFR